MPFEQIASSTPTYLHHDQQGSTRLLTNSEGKATGKYTYTPYGAVETHEGSASTPLGYDGQYRNDSTGLIYLRARVYDPETAQFMSVDPLVAQTGEIYGYVGGSPVNRQDPSGRVPPDIFLTPCLEKAFKEKLVWWKARRWRLWFLKTNEFRIPDDPRIRMTRREIILGLQELREIVAYADYLRYTYGVSIAIPTPARFRPPTRDPIRDPSFFDN